MLALEPLLILIENQEKHGLTARGSHTGPAVRIPRDLQIPPLSKTGSRSDNTGNRTVRNRLVRPTVRQAACVTVAIVIAIALYPFSGQLSTTLRVDELSSYAHIRCLLAYSALVGYKNQVFHRAEALAWPSRKTSRGEISLGLAHIHTNLSQAVAATNSLYSAPALVIQKRKEVSKLQIYEDSFLLAPLAKFYNQSLRFGVDLAQLMDQTSRLGNFAIRQQQKTNQYVHEVQKAEFFYTSDLFRIRAGGLTHHETTLSQRLERQLTLLQDELFKVEALALQVHRHCNNLTDSTEEVRQASIDDPERLLDLKKQTASKMHWFKRGFALSFGLPEFQSTAVLSKNIEIAQGIYEWSQGILVSLERLRTYLLYSQDNINMLLQDIRQQKTIKWNRRDRDDELREFLEGISKGIQMLVVNTEAWSRLELEGYA